MKKSSKHILVIRLSAMGDVAMTVPVLRALLQQNPQVNVTILTRKQFVPLFQDLDGVKAFPVETKGKHKGVFGLYKLTRQLNKENNFYAIADLHSVLRSKVLKQFLNCRRFISINKGREEKKALITGKIFHQLKTTHERYADVFRGMGCEVDFSNPTFPKPKNLCHEILALTGTKSGTWVGVAPFAAHQGKMYPLDLMEKVIKELSKEYKMFLFGGGEQEINALDGISDKYSNTINLSGKLSFPQELDIISNLDLMISMDSGNGHIAAMLGVKVITIWGVTHPFAGFAPFNQPEDFMILPNRKQYPKIPTSVYGNKFPKEYKFASSSIAPEIVIAKAISLLS